MQWLNRLAIAAVAIGLACSIYWAERVRTAPDPRANVRVLDRDGVVLAQRPSERFGWRTYVPLSRMSPALLSAVVAHEDRRFFWHPGIDPVGLVRAIVYNIRAGAFNQGGSTITQQLAKLLIENRLGARVPRKLWWKLAETIVALDCELHLAKGEILERYLNSVYLGNRLYGVETASQAYFGKAAADLTTKEANTLVGHIRRPNQERALVKKPEPEALAPHVLQILTSNDGYSEAIQTTLDATVQASAIHALKTGLRELRKTDDKLQGAVVVVDVKKGELVSLVGSENFADVAHHGEVNHATALRQPGSTLKPFTYFLAFLNHRNPETLVLDAPYHFYLGDEKSYTPNNFTRRFYGVMPIREALANSLNIPAVLTQEEMGTAYYLRALREFGLNSLTGGPSFYGLALTLGSGAVSLLDLTKAYATMARSIGESDRGAAVYLVTSILSDPDARRRSFGDTELMSLDRRPVAVKTGTSHGSRDAWAVGYTPLYAVGVWVGHTDGTPMPGLTGAVAAVPIWHEVMAVLHEGRTPVAFTVPEGITTSSFCRDERCDVVVRDWLASDRTGQPAAGITRTSQPFESFRLITPVDGDHFLLDDRMPKERQQIRCEARLPHELRAEAEARNLPVRWLLDGVEVMTSPAASPSTFLPLVAGRHELRAAVGDAKTRAVRLTISEVE